MNFTMKIGMCVIIFAVVSAFVNPLHAEGPLTEGTHESKLNYADHNVDHTKCDGRQYDQISTSSLESYLQHCASMKMRALGGLLTIGEAELSLVNCYAANNILEPIPKMLSITFERDVSAERLNRMASESMTENLGEGSSFDSIFECISGAYQDTKEGDRYDVLYLPGDGLSLRLNHKLIAHCPDSNWAPQYFNIWFGKKPFHKRLRKELIAQSLSTPDNQTSALPKLPCS